MSEAWKKFKTFVTYLSEQKLYEKQGYLADALSVGEIAPTDAAPMSSAQGEESKTGDGPTGTGVRRKPVRKAWEPVVDVPTSFDQVVSNVTLRCQLLMALAPAKHLAQSRLSAAPATSQLTQKWNDLLAPPTLAPLLMRWSSVGVPTGEDEDVDEDASRALLVGGTKSSPMSPETAAALFRNCVLYATRGANASPRVLLSVYRRRIMRAAQRSFGLAALLSLLKFASFSTARREALMHLRPGLRGKTAWLADTLSGGDRTSPDPSNIRHHYLKALEGVDAPALNGVQAAFIELYVHLGELLVQCSHFGDVGLGHVLSWNWAIDFEPQDHEFVLRVGIVPSLSKLFSMSQQAVVAQSLQRAGPRRDGTSASPPNGWSLWPLEYVRTALTSGTLTKWELVMHMQARGGVPLLSSEAAGEWWRSKQLHRSARTVANNHTIPSLIDLFVEFTARVAVTSTPEADSAAIIIQAAFRSYFVRNVLSKQESGDGSPLPSP